MSITLFFPGLSEQHVHQSEIFRQASQTDVSSLDNQRTIKSLLATILTTPQQSISFFDALLSVMGKSFDEESSGKILLKQHLAVSLCHLAADLKTLHLMPITPLTSQESNQLKNDLNDFLRQDGIRIVAGENSSWLIEWPESVDYRQKSLLEIGFGPLNGIEDSGADRRKVNQLQSELQMLLHQHPVNQMRASKGQPAVNSLWFWRDYSDSDTEPCPYDLVVGDEFLRGLAKGEAATRESLESVIKATLDDNSSLWKSKLALVGSMECQIFDKPSWFEELPGFLDRLASAIYKRQGRSLTLLTHEKIYRLQPWHQRWQFWKKSIIK